MRNTLNRTSIFRIGCVPFLAGALVFAGNASAREDFKPDTPFSKVMKGSGDAVCWNVKRAFLSQGYILDRSSDSVVLTGTKDSQRDDKTTMTIRLQATCVDNKDGSSTVFATAARELSKLQKVRQGVSAGVSLATVTVPTGSENVLQVISRETIQDPAFYNGFYTLVLGYVSGDKGAQSGARDEKASKDDRKAAQDDKAPQRADDKAARDDDKASRDDKYEKSPQSAAGENDRRAAASGSQADEAGRKGSQ